MYPIHNCFLHPRFGYVKGTVKSNPGSLPSIGDKNQRSTIESILLRQVYIGVFQRMRMSKLEIATCLLCGFFTVIPKNLGSILIQKQERVT